MNHSHHSSSRKPEKGFSFPYFFRAITALFLTLTQVVPPSAAAGYFAGRQTLRVAQPETPQQLSGLEEKIKSTPKKAEPLTGDALRKAMVTVRDGKDSRSNFIPSRTEVLQVQQYLSIGTAAKGNRINADGSKQLDPDEERARSLLDRAADRQARYESGEIVLETLPLLHRALLMFGSGNKVSVQFPDPDRTTLTRFAQTAFSRETLPQEFLGKLTTEDRDRVFKPFRLLAAGKGRKSERQLVQIAFEQVREMIRTQYGELLKAEAAPAGKPKGATAADSNGAPKRKSLDHDALIKDWHAASLTVINQLIVWGGADQPGGLNLTMRFAVNKKYKGEFKSNFTLGQMLEWVNGHPNRGISVRDALPESFLVHPSQHNPADINANNQSVLTMQQSLNDFLKEIETRNPFADPEEAPDPDGWVPPWLILPTAGGLEEHGNKWPADFSDSDRRLWQNAFAAHQNEDFPRAADFYTQLLAIHPDHVDALVNLAAVRLGMEDLPGAIELYEQALEIEPENGAISSNLGAAYLMADRLEDGLKKLERAVQLSPESSSAWTNLAAAYSRLDRHDEAVAAGLRATKLTPRDTTSWHTLGRAYFDAGNFLEAVNSYRKVVELNPRLLGGWLALGETQFKASDFTAAENSFEKAVKLNRNDGRAWVGFIESHMKAASVGPQNGGAGSNEILRRSEILFEVWKLIWWHWHHPEPVDSFFLRLPDVSEQLELGGFSPEWMADLLAGKTIDPNELDGFINQDTKTQSRLRLLGAIVAAVYDSALTFKGDALEANKVRFNLALLDPAKISGFLDDEDLDRMISVLIEKLQAPTAGAEERTGEREFNWSVISEQRELVRQLLAPNHPLWETLDATERPKIEKFLQVVSPPDDKNEIAQAYLLLVAKTADLAGQAAYMTNRLQSSTVRPGKHGLAQFSLDRKNESQPLNNFPLTFRMKKEQGKDDEMKVAEPLRILAVLKERKERYLSGQFSLDELPWFARLLVLMALKPKASIFYPNVANEQLAAFAAIAVDGDTGTISPGKQKEILQLAFRKTGEALELQWVKERARLYYQGLDLPEVNADQWLDQGRIPDEVIANAFDAIEAALRQMPADMMPTLPARQPVKAGDPITEDGDGAKPKPKRTRPQAIRELEAASGALSKALATALGDAAWFPINQPGRSRVAVFRGEGKQQRHGASTLKQLDEWMRPNAGNSHVLVVQEADREQGTLSLKAHTVTNTTSTGNMAELEQWAQELQAITQDADFIKALASKLPTAGGLEEVNGNRVSRRNLLKIGGLGLTGLTIWGVLRDPYISLNQMPAEWKDFFAGARSKTAIPYYRADQILKGAGAEPDSRYLFEATGKELGTQSLKEADQFYRFVDPATGESLAFFYSGMDLKKGERKENLLGDLLLSRDGRVDEQWRFSVHPRANGQLIDGAAPNAANPKPEDSERILYRVVSQIEYLPTKIQPVGILTRDRWSDRWIVRTLDRRPLAYLEKISLADSTDASGNTAARAAIEVDSGSTPWFEQPLSASLAKQLRARLDAFQPDNPAGRLTKLMMARRWVQAQVFLGRQEVRVSPEQSVKAADALAGLSLRRDILPEQIVWQAIANTSPWHAMLWEAARQFSDKDGRPLSEDPDLLKTVLRGFRQEIGFSGEEWTDGDQFAWMDLLRYNGLSSFEQMKDFFHLFRIKREMGFESDVMPFLQESIPEFGEELYRAAALQRMGYSTALIAVDPWERKREFDPHTKTLSRQWLTVAIDSKNGGRWMIFGEDPKVLASFGAVDEKSGAVILSEAQAREKTEQFKNGQKAVAFLMKRYAILSLDAKPWAERVEDLSTLASSWDAARMSVPSAFWQQWPLEPIGSGVKPLFQSEMVRRFDAATANLGIKTAPAKLSEEELNKRKAEVASAMGILPARFFSFVNEIVFSPQVMESEGQELVSIQNGKVVRTRGTRKAIGLFDQAKRRITVVSDMSTMLHEMAHALGLNQPELTALFNGISWSRYPRSLNTDPRAWQLQKEENVQVDDFFGWDYGATNGYEDFAVAVQYYGTEGRRTRARVRFQMGRGNFVPAVKYLLIKYLAMFDDDGLSVEYDLGQGSLPITWEEVEKAIAPELAKSEEARRLWRLTGEIREAWLKKLEAVGSTPLVAGLEEDFPSYFRGTQIGIRIIKPIVVPLSGLDKFQGILQQSTVDPRARDYAILVLNSVFYNDSLNELMGLKMLMPAFLRDSQLSPDESTLAEYISLVAQAVKIVFEYRTRPQFMRGYRGLYVHAEIARARKTALAIDNLLQQLEPIVAGGPFIEKTSAHTFKDRNKPYNEIFSESLQKTRGMVSEHLRLLENYSAAGAEEDLRARVAAVRQSQDILANFLLADEHRTIHSRFSTDKAETALDTLDARLKEYRAGRASLETLPLLSRAIITYFGNHNSRAVAQYPEPSDRMLGIFLGRLRPSRKGLIDRRAEMEAEFFIRMGDEKTRILGLYRLLDARLVGKTDEELVHHAFLRIERMVSDTRKYRSLLTQQKPATKAKAIVPSTKGSSVNSDLQTWNETSKAVIDRLIQFAPKGKKEKPDNGSAYHLKGYGGQVPAGLQRSRSLGSLRRWLEKKNRGVRVSDAVPGSFNLSVSEIPLNRASGGDISGVRGSTNSLGIFLKGMERGEDPFQKIDTTHDDSFMKMLRETGALGNHSGLEETETARSAEVLREQIQAIKDGRHFLAQFILDRQDLYALESYPRVNPSGKQDPDLRPAILAELGVRATDYLNGEFVLDQTLPRLHRMLLSYGVGGKSDVARHFSLPREATLIAFIKRWWDQESGLIPLDRKKELRESFLREVWGDEANQILANSRRFSDLVRKAREGGRATADEQIQWLLRQPAEAGQNPIDEAALDRALDEIERMINTNYRPLVQKAFAPKIPARNGSNGAGSEKLAKLPDLHQRSLEVAAKLIELAEPDGRELKPGGVYRLKGKNLAKDASLGDLSDWLSEEGLSDRRVINIDPRFLPTSFDVWPKEVTGTSAALGSIAGDLDNLDGFLADLQRPDGNPFTLYEEEEIDWTNPPWMTQTANAGAEESGKPSVIETARANQLSSIEAWHKKSLAVLDRLIELTPQGRDQLPGRDTPYRFQKSVRAPDLNNPTLGVLRDWVAAEPASGIRVTDNLPQSFSVSPLAIFLDRDDRDGSAINTLSTNLAKQAAFLRVIESYNPFVTAEEVVDPEWQPPWLVQDSKSGLEEDDVSAAVKEGKPSKQLVEFTARLIPVILADPQHPLIPFLRSGDRKVLETFSARYDPDSLKKQDALIVRSSSVLTLAYRKLAGNILADQQPLSSYLKQSSVRTLGFIIARYQRTAGLPSQRRFVDFRRTAEAIAGFQRKAAAYSSGEPRLEDLPRLPLLLIQHGRTLARSAYSIPLKYPEPTEQNLREFADFYWDKQRQEIPGWVRRELRVKFEKEYARLSQLYSVEGLRLGAAMEKLSPRESQEFAARILANGSARFSDEQFARAIDGIESAIRHLADYEKLGADLSEERLLFSQPAGSRARAKPDERLPHLNGRKFKSQDREELIDRWINLSVEFLDQLRQKSSSGLQQSVGRNTRILVYDTVDGGGLSVSEPLTLNDLRRRLNRLQDSGLQIVRRKNDSGKVTLYIRRAIRGIRHSPSIEALRNWEGSLTNSLSDSDLLAKLVQPVGTEPDLVPAAAGDSTLLTTGLEESEETDLVNFLKVVKEITDTRDWEEIEIINSPDLLERLIREDPKLHPDTIKVLNETVVRISDLFLSHPPENEQVILALRQIEAAATRYLMSTWNLTTEAAHSFLADEGAYQGDVWQIQREIWEERAGQLAREVHGREGDDLLNHAVDHSAALAFLEFSSSPRQFYHPGLLQRDLIQYAQTVRLQLRGISNSMGLDPPVFEDRDFADRFQERLGEIREEIPLDFKVQILRGGFVAPIKNARLVLEGFSADVLGYLGHPDLGSELLLSVGERIGILKKDFKSYMLWWPASLNSGLEESEPAAAQIQQMVADPQAALLQSWVLPEQVQQIPEFIPPPMEYRSRWYDVVRHLEEQIGRWETYMDGLTRSHRIFSRISTEAAAQGGTILGQPMLFNALSNLMTVSDHIPARMPLFLSQVDGSLNVVYENEAIVWGIQSLLQREPEMNNEVIVRAIFPGSRSVYVDEKLSAVISLMRVRNRLILRGKQLEEYRDQWSGLIPIPGRTILAKPREFRSITDFLKFYMSARGRYDSIASRLPADAEANISVLTLPNYSPRTAGKVNVFVRQSSPFGLADWEVALELALNGQDTKIDGLSFIIQAYPVNGRLPEGQISVIVEQVGNGPLLQANPNVPIVRFRQLKDLDKITAAWLHSVAVNQALKGAIIGPLVDEITFQDEHDQTIHALFV